MPKTNKHQYIAIALICLLSGVLIGAYAFSSHTKTTEHVYEIIDINESYSFCLWLNATITKEPSVIGHLYYGEQFWNTSYGINARCDSKDRGREPRTNYLIKKEMSAYYIRGIYSLGDLYEC